MPHIERERERERERDKRVRVNELKTSNSKRAMVDTKMKLRSLIFLASLMDSTPTVSVFFFFL